MTKIGLIRELREVEERMRAATPRVVASFEFTEMLQRREALRSELMQRNYTP